jgi:hypothetical protein
LVHGEVPVHTFLADALAFHAHTLRLVVGKLSLRF